MRWRIYGEAQLPSPAAWEAAFSQISKALSPWKMSCLASCLMSAPVFASMTAKVGSSATLNFDLSDYFVSSASKGMEFHGILAMLRLKWLISRSSDTNTISMRSLFSPALTTSQNFSFRLVV